MSVIDEQRQNISERASAPYTMARAAGERRWLMFLSALIMFVLVVLAAVPWWMAIGAFIVLACGIALTGRSLPSSDIPANPSSLRARRDLDGRSALLIAALPDPCIVVNRRAVVVMHNEHAISAVPGLRVGDPLAFVLRIPAVTEALRKVIAGAEPQILNYSDLVPVERSFEARITPVRIEPTGANEPPDYVVVTLQDETKRKRLETMRVDFVANASHELRTPLASLLGFIETLQGPARNDTPARERFLVIMREQALRMARLIDDLLSLSQIELNLHIRPQGRVDIAPILGQTIDALTPLARENRTDLSLAAMPAPLWVQGQRDEIYRVAENLIENAIKYGGVDGKVMVSAQQEMTKDGFPASIAITVVDNGPGIAPEDLPRLTERFYRVDTASSRAKGGTGLGLAIVKHIIARHRGRLDIASEVGKGSKFTVRFDEAQPQETGNSLDRPLAVK